MAWTPASQPGGMNEIVVDTDVISFIFKGHTIGSRYEADLSGRVCLISFMTVAELARWAIERNWSPQRTAWLHTYLRRFTVVDSSPDLCEKWGEAMVSAIRAGRRIEPSDAWIAATALLFGVPLLTHNRTVYSGVPGLNLISYA
jgi:predicted nucleic acid-binding protein